MITPGPTDPQAGGDWEVRPNGNDDNGGGFWSYIAGAAGADYSQQDVAQLSLTDLVLSGSNPGPWTVTSTTGGFTADMVGNALGVVGVNGGHFPILSVIDTNTITIGYTVGGGSPNFPGWGGAKAGKVGGGLAHLSLIGEAGDTFGTVGIITTTTNGPLPSGGCVIHVKAGSYVDVPIGAFSLGTPYGRQLLEGYEVAHGDGCPTSRPVIQSSANTSGPYSLFDSSQAGFGGLFEIRNIVFDANGVCWYAMFHYKINVRYVNCWFKGGKYGAADFEDGVALDCEFSNSGAGGMAWDGDPTNFDFKTAGVIMEDYCPHLIGCRIHDNNGPGIYNDGRGLAMSRCVVDHNQGSGMFQDRVDAPITLVNCNFDHNGYDGMVANTGSGPPSNGLLWDRLMVQNCTFTNNGAGGSGGAGINSQDSDYAANGPACMAERLNNNAFYSNDDGDEVRVPAGAAKIALAASPFADPATGDYSLNADALGGELLKGTAT